MPVTMMKYNDPTFDMTLVHEHMEMTGLVMPVDFNRENYKGHDLFVVISSGSPTQAQIGYAVCKPEYNEHISGFVYNISAIYMHHGSSKELFNTITQQARYMGYKLITGALPHTNKSKCFLRNGFAPLETIYAMKVNPND